MIENIADGGFPNREIVLPKELPRVSKIEEASKIKFD
jgi:hypothetical protein